MQKITDDLTIKSTLNFLYFSKNFPYKWEEKCFESN